MASSLQCDVSTPFNLCGVNTFFNPQSEFSACSEQFVLIGQMTSAGTAAPGVPVQVFQNGAELFGNGSMLAQMVDAARCEGQFLEIWALPLADFGTMGTANITFSGAAAATAAETLSLIVNGNAYSISFAPGDTDAMIAAAFALAITEPSVTASAAGDVLTLTSVNGGEVGGAINLQTNSAALGIDDPVQVDFAVVNTPGVGTPPLAAALPALESGQFTFVANPYPDGPSQRVVEDYICASWAPRNPTRAESFTVIGGDISDAQALATANGVPQMHPAYLPGTPTPYYAVTASYAARVYSVLNSCNDPLILSNPLNGEPLTCVEAPDVGSRLSVIEMDALIGDGVSILGVNATGTVEIVEFTTAYTVDRSGNLDASFRDGSHVARLRYIANYVETRIQQTYGRHIIRADRFTPRPGQRAVTVWQLRAFIQSFGVELSELNLIEDPTSFSELVDVQWDGGNSCVNIAIAPDLVNKLCCINLFVNSRI